MSGSKFTTISLSPKVAEDLRNLFRECGGRDVFNNLSNFIRVLLVLASFYPPDRLKQIHYLLLGKERNRQEMLEMVRIYFEVLEARLHKQDREEVKGIIPSKRIVNELSQSVFKDTPPHSKAVISDQIDVEIEPASRDEGQVLSLDEEPSSDHSPLDDVL